MFFKSFNSVLSTKRKQKLILKVAEIQKVFWLWSQQKVPNHSWAENLNAFTVMNEEFKFYAQKSDLAPFVGNGTKLKNTFRDQLLECFYVKSQNCTILWTRFVLK